MRRAHAAWPRAFDSLPSQDPDRGWLYALKKVRILIFDDPAELYERQSPQFCSSQLNSTQVLNLDTRVYY
jgi:hypothetical protein